MSGPENGMSVRIFGSEPAGHACGPPRGEAPARMGFAILGGHRLRAFCGAGFRSAWVLRFLEVAKRRSARCRRVTKQPDNNHETTRNRKPTVSPSVFSHVWLSTRKKRPGRCLDAAHGESVGAVGTVERTHVARIEEYPARVVVARGERRRRQSRALDADAAQGSRRSVAVARSRRKGRSLGWMVRRGRTNGFARNRAAPRAVRAAALAGGVPQACSADCARNSVRG